MSTETKIWTVEYIESDEGKKRIEEIVRLVISQSEKDLEILAVKTIEAYDTCIEMAPSIKNDFRVDPLPHKLLEYLLTYGPMNKNTLKELGNLEAISDYVASLNMDEVLQAYGEWRKNKYYKILKWNELYEDLTNANYIRGSSPQVFGKIMEFKSLPHGEKKVQWLMSKAAALYFQKKLGFTVKQLNQCFRSKNGKSFAEHNRAINDPREPLPSIIKKIIDNSKT